MSIITVTGPSGAGKSTLVEMLLKSGPGFRILRSVTCTRKPRVGDNPDDYLLVSEEEFIEMAVDGHFIWVTEPIHGNTFATEFSAVNGALASPDRYLMVISPEHAELMRRHVNGCENLLLQLFLSSPGEVELRRRISRRPGSTPEDTERRIIECEEWEDEARAQSVVPYHFVDTRGTPESACAFVRRLIAQHLPS